MKLGVVFPQTEIGTDPFAIRDYAQTAEGLGYDYLLVYDHVLGANPNTKDPGIYTSADSFHEPFVLFGYLAGLTQTIELVTGILILPQRQTALVAKQAAQADLLSGGRLRLGIGVGWNKLEYDALNRDFSTRGKRVEEQVVLLRELWTKQHVTFKGTYHTIEEAGLNPRPVNRPIPIWFGGYADAALRRAARMGGGWLPGGQEPNERVKTIVAQLKGYVAEAGRDPEAFGIDPWISISRHPQTEWAKLAKRWQALGATHIGVNTMGAGFQSLQEHLEAIARFKDIVSG